MNKYIYILCGILSGVFASCSQNVPEEDIPLSNQTILKVVADEGLQTRGTATGVDHFAIEVYTDDTYETTANVFENGKTNKATSTTGEFAMILDRTQEYCCLLWANKGGSTAYDLTSLKAVALTGKATEAWHGTKKIAAAADASLTATLTRAVSKITLLETGKLKAGTVKLNFDQPTAFNVADGTTSGTATARPEETVTIAADVDGSTAPTNGVKLNSTDIFVLSSVAVADVTNLTLQYASEEAFTVSNVPLKANFNTNIKGHYTSAKTGSTFTVTCDGEWETGDNKVEFPAIP